MTSWSIMGRADPALRDREMIGWGGMLVWGALSSVGLVLIPLVPVVWTVMPDLLAFVLFAVTIALVIAIVVWGIGGLFVAMPLWTLFIATGMRGRWLIFTMTVAGAVIVGGIWAAFVRAPFGSAAFLVVFGMGALTGALGGYGFCRSAMRS